jgi:hypothetical protein
MKDKIDELATNTKNKNIRDLSRRMNEFKRGYQPNNDVRQICLRTAEPLVPSPSPFKVEIGVATLKKYKSKTEIRFCQN